VTEGVGLSNVQVVWRWARGIAHAPANGCVFGFAGWLTQQSSLGSRGGRDECSCDRSRGVGTLLPELVFQGSVLSSGAVTEALRPRSAKYPESSSWYCPDYGK